MAPILPGLSDRPDLLEDVVREARAVGATGVWANLLYLRPGTLEHFMANLARDWPELLPRYQAMYEGRAYLSKAVAEPVRRQVTRLRERHGVADRRRVRLEPIPELEPLQLQLVDAAAASVTAVPEPAIQPPTAAHA